MLAPIVLELEAGVWAGVPCWTGRAERWRLSVAVAYDIMMAGAPPELGGVISAVKPAVGQAAYSLGPALFALIATTLFLQDGRAKLQGSGITEQQAKEALRIAHGGVASPAGGGEALDPERASWVVSEATDSWIAAIHHLSLLMATVPAAAIVVAMVLLRPRPAAPAVGTDEP